MPRPPTAVRTLVVEGPDDKHSVAHLIRAHVRWPDAEPDWPVRFRPEGGKDRILVEGFITGLLKEPGARAVGVVLDADDNPGGRYHSVRGLCGDVIPELPVSMPGEGLVAENGDGARFGLWIMPDNAAHGSLETFLWELIPHGAGRLRDHAAESSARARALGAPYRSVDAAKADIHTWLAWQDPPGRPFGIALTARMLDPHAPEVAPFVHWFRRLFEL